MALLLKDLAISFSNEPVVSRALQHRPPVTAQATAEALTLSLPTVGKNLELLDDLGVIREITGKRRNCLSAYNSYLDLLDRGTEPLPALWAHGSPLLQLRRLLRAHWRRPRHAR